MYVWAGHGHLFWTTMVSSRLEVENSIGLQQEGCIFPDGGSVEPLVKSEEYVDQNSVVRVAGDSLGDLENVKHHRCGNEKNILDGD